ncbi:hypothetical protein, partial [Vibrio parahaemolyticus]|uniref:hypothetical protein n=1 Tax=Vibrio parahaemolyticus TaxID=670 RepID=UPI0030811F30
IAIFIGLLGSFLLLQELESLVKNTMDKAASKNRFKIIPPNALLRCEQRNTEAPAYHLNH